MSLAPAEPGSVSPARAALLGVATSVGAFVAPLALATAGSGWLVRTFGAAAPAGVVVAGIAGALLAGLTVGVVLAALRASQPVFLGAWAGSTLVRLAGLAVLVLLPVTAPGATQGLLIGYVAAVVLGSVIEVPTVWIVGGRATALAQVVR